MNAGRYIGAAAVAATALALASPAGASVLKVNTAADSTANDGDCSLREAIQSTNTNQSFNGADDCKHVNGDTGPDLIRLPDGLYPIEGIAGDDGNSVGDLDIEAGEKLEIRGNGTPTLQGDLDRAIHLESGKLLLNGIAITDGEAGSGRGGGILADGPGRLIVSGGLVQNSSAARGGAIAVDDSAMSLTVKGGNIQQNVADGGTVFDGGGGIYFDGKSLSIDRTTVAGNETLNGDGGGISVRGQGGSLEITRTSIFANHADEHGGGGLYYDPPPAKGTLSHSLVSLNTANFAGGGIDVSNDPSTLVVKTTSITNNSLSSTIDEFIGGGGISNGGTTRLVNSIVSGNFLLAPGGLADGLGAGIRNDNGTQMTISGTLISLNHGANISGAGIYSSQPLGVTNSTLSQNDAGTGVGGGIRQTGDPITLSHVTLAENDADGDADAIAGDPDEVTLHASIIDNGLNACDDGATTSGYNVDAGASCGLGISGDAIGATIGLRPLADNGGPPIGLPELESSALTYALKKSSPAINRVPRKKCVDAAGKRLRKDQRAVKRPQGKRCDSGACERKAR